MVKRKIWPIRSLSGGINTLVAPEQLDNDEAVEAVNVDFYRGKVRKTNGFNQFTANVFTEPVTFIDQFWDLSNATHFFGFTPNSIWKYDSATDTWTDVSPVAGITGATIKDRWGSVQFPYTDGVGTFHDAYIVTNFVSGILKFEPGATNFDTLPGTVDFKATALTAYRNHLVLGRLQEGSTLAPQRIRWSDTGNAEEWAAGNAGFVDLIETADWVVGFAMLRDTLYIFKERSIWRMYYRGTASKLFEFELVIDGIGARSPDTIVSLGDQIIFLGWDNVYTFDGVRVTPVGDPVQNDIFGPNSQLNEDYTDAFWAIFLEERSEYWVFLVTGANTSPNICYKYDTSSDSWCRMEFGATGGGYYIDEKGAIPWQSIQGTWQDATYAWISQNLEGGRPITLFGLSDGRILENSQLVYIDREGVWRSKNFVFEIPQRIFSIRLLAEGVVGVRFSFDGGITWTALRTYTVGSTPSWIRVPINRVSSRIMTEVRIASTDYGAVTRMEIETAGRSRLG